MPAAFQSGLRKKGWGKCRSKRDYRICLFRILLESIVRIDGICRSRHWDTCAPVQKKRLLEVVVVKTLSTLEPSSSPQAEGPLLLPDPVQPVNVQPVHWLSVGVQGSPAMFSDTLMCAHTKRQDCLVRQRWRFSGLSFSPLWCGRLPQGLLFVHYVA